MAELERSPVISFLANEGENPCGLVMGADYTAEHEHGVERLMALLGIVSDDKPGLDGRTMSEGIEESQGRFVYIRDVTVNEVLFPRNGGYSSRDQIKIKSHVDILYVGEGLCYMDGDDKKAIVERLLTKRMYADQEFMGGWSDKAFSIIAYSEEAKAYLDRIATAIKAGDLAIWTGSYGRFTKRIPGGLHLAIASSVPEQNKTAILDYDLDKIALVKAAVACGIEERIAASLNEKGALYSRCGVFRLTPKWIKNSHRAKDFVASAYDVMFFVAPLRTTEYNADWYTVEEIDAWISGGPLVCSK